MRASLKHHIEIFYKFSLTSFLYFYIIMNNPIARFKRKWAVQLYRLTEKTTVGSCTVKTVITNISLCGQY